MHRTEESLLLGHLRPHFQSLVVEMQTSVDVPVAPQHIVPKLIRKKDQGEVSWEVVFILASELPLVGTWESALLLGRVHGEVSLHLPLVEKLLFKLRMVEGVNTHSADALPSKLEPESLIALVHEKVVLVRVAPEQLCLCDHIIPAIYQILIFVLFLLPVLCLFLVSRPHRSSTTWHPYISAVGHLPLINVPYSPHKLIGCLIP